MHNEHGNHKRNVIDLEDSPFGHGHDNDLKMENIEHNFSLLSFDLFHYNSGKKEEKVEVQELSQLAVINEQLS